MSITIATSPASSVKNPFGALLRWLSVRKERESAINELQGLTDARLRDIGVERADIATRIDTELAKIDLKRLGQIGLC